MAPRPSRPRSGSDARRQTTCRHGPEDQLDEERVLPPRSRDEARLLGGASVQFCLRRFHAAYLTCSMSEERRPVAASTRARRWPRRRASVPSPPVGGRDDVAPEPGLGQLAGREAFRCMPHGLPRSAEMHPRRSRDHPGLLERVGGAVARVLLDRQVASHGHTEPPVTGLASGVEACSRHRASPRRTVAGERERGGALARYDRAQQIAGSAARRRRERAQARRARPGRSGTWSQAHRRHGVADAAVDDVEDGSAEEPAPGARGRGAFVDHRQAVGSGMDRRQGRRGREHGGRRVRCA